MDQKISVIIPIYNAEKYLLPTLNTVRFQTHHNLEIICVLDCPTDHSEEIVREIAKEDNRIKIISNHQNLGPAKTRNNGINNATGQYIHFMDSDDFITHDFYEVLLTAANKTDADVSACSVFYEQRPKQSIWFTNDEVITGKAKIHKSEVLFRGWAWRYLIRKSFWDEREFSFPDFSLMEDIVVAISLIHHANKIVLCPEAVYFYKNRNSSIINRKTQDNPELEKKRVEDGRNASMALDDLRKNYKIERPSTLLRKRERTNGKYICTNDPITYGEFEKKISVVMPIYNVEKYLLRALNSVRFQTYRNLEIICVLDCPTDRSTDIATNLAAEDTRIKLVAHSINKGLPSARNSGVANATGEYIHFMDSDDWLSPDFYETLLKASQKTQADVAACSIYYEKKPKKSIWFQKSEVLSDVNAKFEKTEATIQGWAVRYLIKKSFWDERNFSFPDLVPMEDKPVMIPMIYYANEVVLCPGAVYFYKNRESSILNKKYDAAREKQRSANRHAARKIFNDFMKSHKIKPPNRLFYFLKKYLA